MTEFCLAASRKLVLTPSREWPKASNSTILFVSVHPPCPCSLKVQALLDLIYRHNAAYSSFPAFLDEEESHTVCNMSVLYTHWNLYKVWGWPSILIISLSLLILLHLIIELANNATIKDLANKRIGDNIVNQILGDNSLQYWPCNQWVLQFGSGSYVCMKYSWRESKVWLWQGAGPFVEGRAKRDYGWLGRPFRPQPPPN